MILQSLFLSPNDLWKIEGYSCYQSAWRGFRTLLYSLGKKPGQKITIPEYCKYMNIDQKDVMEKIRSTRLPQKKNYNTAQQQLFS